MYKTKTIRIRVHFSSEITETRRKLHIIFKQLKERIIIPETYNQPKHSSGIKMEIKTLLDEGKLK